MIKPITPLPGPNDRYSFLAIDQNKNGVKLKLHRSVDFGEVSNFRNGRESVGKYQLFESGTQYAFKYLDIGGGVDSLSIEAIKGRKNEFSGKKTDCLSSDQARKLVDAKRFASAIGLPFTRLTTIHWESAGVAADALVKATGKYLDLLSKALKRAGVRPAYIWVQESGPQIGHHVHILVHIPSKALKRVDRWRFRWLKSITGKSYKRNVINSRPIGGLLDLENGNQALFRENLEVIGDYMLKGVCPSVAKQFHLRRLQPGGICFGKRCGFSQSIGPSAQLKHARLLQLKP